MGQLKVTRQCRQSRFYKHATITPYKPDLIEYCIIITSVTYIIIITNVTVSAGFTEIDDLVFLVHTLLTIIIRIFIGVLIN